MGKFDNVIEIESSDESSDGYLDEFDDDVFDATSLYGHSFSNSVASSSQPGQNGNLESQTMQRILPPTFMNCKRNASSASRVLPPSFSSRNMACDRSNQDKIFQPNERVMFDEVVQSMQQRGQPSMEDDLPVGKLAVSLLKHQIIALAWMVRKEKSSHCAGGILADDQGLGKTVSTIALIQKQMNEQDKFKRVSDHALVALNVDEDDDEVVMFDGKVMKDEPEREPDIDASSKRKSEVSACPSTASRPAAGTLVVCPASVLKQWDNELLEKVPASSRLSVLIYHGGGRTKDPNELAGYDVVVTTYTIVANEVPKQSLSDEDDSEEKNSNKYGLTREFSSRKKRKSLSNMESKSKKKKGKKHRDIDIDNDAGPLARVRWFRVVLDEAQTIKNYRTQVSRACCGLRAKKRWCLSGTPIQNAIDDLYSYFRFLKFEPLSVYSSFCSSIKYPISRNASDGYKKLRAVLQTVLLRRTKETKIDGVPIINLPSKTITLTSVDFTPEERLFYLTLEESSRKQFKAYAAAGTVKQNYASILSMLLRLRQACDHPILVNGTKTEFIGKDAIQTARQRPREMLEYLLDKLEGYSAICNICSDIPEDAVVALCGHVFCFQCISERLSGDENVCPASSCREVLSTDSVFSQHVLKISISDSADRTTATSSPSSAKSAITQSSYVSSKIEATLDILNSIFTSSDCTEVTGGTDGVPVKAIVFSQWTRMLDLVELSLNRCLIQYRRLDGTMTLNVRDRAVKEFNTDPEVRVMLMSLKAGNLGLNMVAASHVILLDLWWNPYAEDQAVDRAHRIGQTRPVTVSRLTIQDTVEDRILALQEEKRKMVSSAFGEGSSNTATGLTIQDLMFLFKT